MSGVLFMERGEIMERILTVAIMTILVVNLLSVVALAAYGLYTHLFEEKKYFMAFCELITISYLVTLLIALVRQK
jgi:uncharacterized membrane protein